MSGSSQDSQRACRPRWRSARDQPGVVTVTLGQRRATGEHDARMENVGPGKFHGDLGGKIVSMHAIEVAETGGPEVLTYVEKPQPSPGPGQVLIKAEAIGVNFLDTYFRSGQYPREVPFVVGAEVCGTVEAVGDDVAALQRRRPRRHRAGRSAPTPNTASPQLISSPTCPRGVAPMWPPRRCSKA